MPETILIALLYAKSKKYLVKPLFKTKEIYYVLGIEFIYILLQITLFVGDYTFLKYVGILKSIYLCSYLGLIFRHELYKQAIIGAGCIILGGMSNDLAMAANGGKMPIFPTLSYITGYIKPESLEVAGKVANDFHILGNSETNMKILTDFLDVGYSILSVGDVLIRVFVFLIIYSAIKKINLIKTDQAR